MSKRTNLNALLFMLVFLLAMVGTTFAGPVWDLQVGMWWELDKHDSAVPPNEWVVRMEVLGQETIGPHDYFRIGYWNYDPGIYGEFLVRCTEDAVYRYMGTGEHLALKAGVLGEWWTYEYPKWSDGVMHVEIISIEEVTVPYGYFSTAYVHKRHFVPDVGDPEPPHIYNWFVPGYGVVREEDHYWETLHGPTVQELARMGIIPVVELIGDFCGPNSGPPDGYVDYWDLLHFAQRWHTSLGDLLWDSRCDLAEEDDYVDYHDLLVFAQHWHEGQE